MTFSKKIFVSVFFTALTLGSLIIWTSHRFVSKQTEEKFVSRYSVFTNVLSSTLTRLDINTEALMLNAVKVVAAKDLANGLLSTDALKAMREELNMTHIFVLDKKGKFIRSTNEDPRLIPNVFSFCPAYKNMIVGNTNVEVTPIIHPRPEPKPYKFLFVPSQDRKRIFEVGMRIDFIANTLGDAIGADENLDSMSLYNPHGTLFGRFNSKKVNFEVGTMEIPSEFPKVIEAADSYHFFTKVVSSHPKCCQCDVSKVSKNGEYYYILEAKVSKKELNAVLASTNTRFLLLGLGNLILAIFLSRLISRRLVRNIEKATSKIREIQSDGNLKDRICLKGNDEVAFLTSEFDILLDKLETSQNQIIESEKIQAKVQMAREVAHNIKSPVIALEMILPSLSTIPIRLQNVLKNSVKEIKTLTERLKSQADSMAIVPINCTTAFELELLFLPTFLQDMVNCKAQEWSKRNIKIQFVNLALSQLTFAKANPLELKSVLSNIVNNAAESYAGRSGAVDVSLSSTDEFVLISVIDYGVGIPKEYLNELGKKQITFKGGCDRGLGLVHANRIIANWRGSLSIESELGKGTCIKIQIPIYKEIKKSIEQKISAL